MLSDRVLNFSYAISLVIHAVVLVIFPGQEILKPVVNPEWIEVDIFSIPEVDVSSRELPNVADGSSKSDAESFSEEPALGDSSTYAAPPVWLPERLETFDAEPLSETLLLPGSMLPEVAGTGFGLPGTLSFEESSEPGDTVHNLGSPPDFAWQPRKTLIKDSQDDDPGTFVIQGPVARRTVIHRPAPPQAVTNLSGTVRLKFWVHPDGTVGKIVPVVRADPELEKIAIEYLEKWRFATVSPGTGDQWGTIPIRFKLQ